MILALKTADATTHFWLLENAASGQIAGHEWESGRQLSDQLLRQILEFLGSQNCGLKDLTGIAVFSGPGSFTSLRIGHTVANALADSLQIPVAGATGDDWLSDAATALADTPAGQPVLPHYGAEANITRPKP